MKKPVLAMTGLLAMVSAGGCGYDGAKSAESTKRQIAREGAAPVNYQEVPYEGRIYVLSTSKAADDARKGTLPPIALTKIGAGPNRETVVFEANAKTYVEDSLIAEWNARHGSKINK